MKVKWLFLFLLFAKSGILFGQLASITRYKVYNGYAVSTQGDTTIILRSFSQNRTSQFLVLNPNSLQTCVVPLDSVKSVKAKREVLADLFAKTPYFRTIKVAEYTSEKVKNAGVRRFQRTASGVDLTIDLCPSMLPLDRDFFLALVKSLSAVQKPVPIAISVTGTWMKGHPSDFSWLLQQVKLGDIDITWINHSYSHRVDKDLPLSENFLLEKGTDISREILNTEITMLERSVIPSPFFRFPGLVSDKEVFEKVISFGLIPIGTDAWIAKKQYPKQGSIVLVHANGNEPLGLKKFQKLLETQRDSILAGKWMLFDLRESISKETANK